MILTVLDMIDEKYHIQQSNFQKLIENRAIMINAADHIIAISENTRKDIIEYFNIDEKKVTTIHLGCSLDKDMINQYTNNSRDNITAVLFIGSRKGTHKNFNNYIQAIKLIVNLDENIEFIFGGGGEFTNQEKEAINDLGIEKYIKYIPIHSDNDIIQLYKNATLLVYPSLYEGFGLPLVEAFNCGTPCITAKGSCLEEVGGNAALYFDPLNPMDIANKVITVIESPNLQNELISNGYLRAELFTWENTVRNTFKVYENLLNKKIIL
jgi:glycosyltransferase involved in cell wall biosynthesis